MPDEKAGRGSSADYCSVYPIDGHHMVSRSTGGAKVRFVELCSVCGWIDGAALDGWADNAIKEALSARAQRIAVATETEPFAFVQRSDEELTLWEILYQALGAAEANGQAERRTPGEAHERRKAIAAALSREVTVALARSAKPWQDLAYEAYALARDLEKAGSVIEMPDWTRRIERIQRGFGGSDQGDLPGRPGVVQGADVHAAE